MFELPYAVCCQHDRTYVVYVESLVIYDVASFAAEAQEGALALATFLSWFSELRTKLLALNGST